MKAKNIEPITKYMATRLITFTPETDIRDAMAAIVRNKISGAPVLDKDGHLVGVLSEKDCIRTVVTGPYNRRPGGIGTVGDYMSVNIKTLSDELSILDAAFEFAHAPYRRFPVVDREGRLVGQISRRDVLQAIVNMGDWIEHIPSSWQGRVPTVEPSKRSHHTGNT